MESVVTFLDDNLRKFHVLYACTGGAYALETRRRFVTERGKKKTEPKFNARPHCLGNNSNYLQAENVRRAITRHFMPVFKTYLQAAEQPTVECLFHSNYFLFTSAMRKAHYSFAKLFYLLFIVALNRKAPVPVQLHTGRLGNLVLKSAKRQEHFGEFARKTNF